jgi:hypothetical protein
VFVWNRLPSIDDLCKFAVWIGAGTGKVVALGSIPIPGADPVIGCATSGELCTTRPLTGDGAARFFCGWIAGVFRRPSFSLSGN